jgi:hypothetical protein
MWRKQTMSKTIQPFLESYKSAHSFDARKELVGRLMAAPHYYQAKGTYTLLMSYITGIGCRGGKPDAYNRALAAEALQRLCDNAADPGQYFRANDIKILRAMTQPDDKREDNRYVRDLLTNIHQLVQGKSAERYNDLLPAAVQNDLLLEQIVAKQQMSPAEEQKLIKSLHLYSSADAKLHILDTLSQNKWMLGSERLFTALIRMAGTSRGSNKTSVAVLNKTISVMTDALERTPSLARSVAKDEQVKSYILALRQRRVSQGPIERFCDLLTKQAPQIGNELLTPKEQFIETARTLAVTGDDSLKAGQLKTIFTLLSDKQRKDLLPPIEQDIPAFSSAPLFDVLLTDVLRGRLPTEQRPYRVQIFNILSQMIEHNPKVARLPLPHEQAELDRNCTQKLISMSQAAILFRDTINTIETAQRHTADTKLAPAAIISNPWMLSIAQLQMK